MEVKTLTFPKLDLLTPTLESTCLKLMEEAGELAQLIGKHRKMSGESDTQLTPTETIDNIASELLDVAQVAITMMYVLEDIYNVDLDKHLLQHTVKLINKGYCTPPSRGGNQ